MRVESDGMLSVAAVLAESALRRPDHPAVVHEGRELRYGELWERARRHAAVLRAAGTRPGDRVALLLTDTPHFPAVYFGVLALGAVVVPVHPLLRAGQIAHVLRDSGARTLVCSAAMLPQALTAVRDATAEPGPPVVVFALDDAPPAAAGGPGPGRPAAGPHGAPPEPAGERTGERTDGVPRIDLLAARAEPVEGYLPRAPGDVAVILYTSGTTGRPKGAALTHLNIVMNLMTTARSPFDMGPGDRLLGCLPLSHTFGQLCGMGVCFLAGATLVLMSRFEARRAVELMAAHDCTVFMGVPTMYLALLEAVAADPGGPRPRLDRAYSGGSALPVKVLEEVQEVFGCTVYEGYGLTETSPVVAYNQKAWPTRPGTVGRPVWGVEVGIARPDVEGRIELLPGAAVGEVVVRGHNVMAGYHGRPDATAEVLVDGWFRTGDLGRVDADGCLTIVDRKKDLVVRGGYNVYPREVEEVLVHHPAVARVAVIGVPDRVHGEEVCAVVVPGPGRVADAALAAEITAWARERIAAHQYPRRVEFLPELPLGISGKVLKRELAARFGS